MGKRAAAIDERQGLIPIDAAALTARFDAELKRLGPPED